MTCEFTVLHQKLSLWSEEMADLPTYLPIYRRTYMHAYIHTFFVGMLRLVNLFALRWWSFPLPWRYYVLLLRACVSAEQAGHVAGRIFRSALHRGSSKTQMLS